MTTDLSHWEEESKDDCHAMLVDPDGWWEARLHEDGCVDLRRYHNHPRDEQKVRADDPSHMDLEDYLHICDMEKFIERMIEVLAYGEHVFPEWNYR